MCFTFWMTPHLLFSIFSSYALSRCNMDSTIEIYSPANKTQFRFSIEAFKFIGMHDQVRTGLCGETSLWSSICEVHQVLAAQKKNNESVATGGIIGQLNRRRSVT